MGMVTFFNKLRRGFVLPLLLFMSGFCISQTKNIIAEYDYKTNFDDKKKSENIAKIIGADSIFYFSVHKKATNNRIDSIKTDTTTIIRHIKGSKEKINWIAKKINSKIILEEANQGYYVKDTLFAIKWKMVNEQMQIDSLICQKAVAKFRGRNYIAWFSLKYPINIGPWKLDGLPGLIIEAYTDDKTYYWKLRSLSFVNDYLLDNNKVINEIILKNNTAIEIDPKSYYLLKKAEYEKSINNHLKYAESAHGGYQNMKMNLNMRESF